VSYLREVNPVYNEGGMEGREEIREGHKVLEDPSLLYIVKHKL